VIISVPVPVPVPVPADYVPGRLLQDQHGRSVSSTLS